MQIQDFVFIVGCALMMMPSLLSVFLVLRFLNWNQRNSVLLDSWRIWLSWFLSTIVAYLLLVVVDLNTNLIRFEGLKLSVIIIGSVVIINLLFIGATISFIQRRRGKDGNIQILKTTAYVEPSQPRFLSVTILTTFAAIFGMVIGVITMTQINRIYDHYYSPPKSEYFQIYDIS